MCTREAEAYFFVWKRVRFGSEFQKFGHLSILVPGGLHSSVYIPFWPPGILKIAERLGTNEIPTKALLTLQDDIQAKGPPDDILSIPLAFFNLEAVKSAWDGVKLEIPNLRYEQHYWEKVRNVLTAGFRLLISPHDVAITLDGALAIFNDINKNLLTQFESSPPFKTIELCVLRQRLNKMLLKIYRHQYHPSEDRPANKLPGPLEEFLNEHIIQAETGVDGDARKESLLRHMNELEEKYPELEMGLKYRRDGAYIFVWHPSILPWRGVGHLSFLLPDTKNTYISFWPGDTPSSLQAVIKTKIPSTFVLTLEDDIKAEGRKPDDMIWIPSKFLVMGAVKQAWEEVQGKDDYSLLITNCATTVRKVLKAGCIFYYPDDISFPSPRTIFDQIVSAFQTRLDTKFVFDTETKKFVRVRQEQNWEILKSYEYHPIPVFNVTSLEELLNEHAREMNFDPRTLSLIGLIILAE